MVVSVNGSAGEPELAGSFMNEVAAEAFIRSQVANDKSYRFDADRHWVRNLAGGQIGYWIETDQETASVKNTHEE